MAPASALQPEPDVRPPAFRLRLARALDFPRRFCNPPHVTVGRVRSWSVVPTYEVTLDDVLERRHLPPLGLKDFEEWLLFVERRPQLLYFVLWLRDYRRRHEDWSRSVRRRRQASPSTATGTRPISSSLSLFYTRAKHTFFSQRSPYALPLPPSSLKQFIHPPIDSSTDSPHPDPAVFTPVEQDVRTLLSVSLRRFVRAAFANVSTYRAICGVMGGSVIFILLGLLPLLLTLFFGHPRWLRLTALPGMIIGATIVVASLHGLCVGIYLFGDARQLHSFELLRPDISQPTALALSCQPLDRPPAIIVTKHKDEPATPQESRLSISSAQSDSTRNRTASSHSPSQDRIEIYVSPAMDPDTGEYSESIMDQDIFDEDEDGKKTALHTAAFIRPFVAWDQKMDLESQNADPPCQTQLDPFDFRGLPNVCADEKVPLADAHPLASFPASPTQHRFSVDRPLTDPPAPTNTTVELDETVSHSHSHHSQPMYASVPPFGPLTQVLSPVVARAHWEILVRSTGIASVLCLAAMGGLLGIPEFGGH